MSTHEHYMQAALVLAQQAADNNEVPIGAVVVVDDKIIGRGFNQSISLNDPSAHAEVLALRDAAKTIDNYRLVDAALYVTLEPCMMCAGAMVHARIKQLVFGAYDPKSGVIESRGNFLASDFLNHQIETIGGVLADDARILLQDFFKARRK